MALSSMTGFARGQGTAGSYAWNWEIKSVNAKGLDLRFRLPPGWDAVEVPARARTAEKLSRGTIYANLTVDRKGVLPTAKINEPVLSAILSTLKSLSGKVEAAPATLDGILSLRGVIEIAEEDEREEDHRAAEAAIIVAFEKALAAMIDMRRAEGATLGQLLTTRLDEIAKLAGRAENAPGRKRKPSGPGWLNRSRSFCQLRSGLIPTACTRRQFCSRQKQTSARNSTGFLLMSSRRKGFSSAAARSAANSIFSRRSFIANRIH